MDLAHKVAECNYENNTKWGFELSEPWFVLYVFLFLGAYGHDLLEFIVEGSTVQRWWNDQRMRMIRSTFSSVISTYGFSLTNKFVDDEQSKRYDQGVFDFGVPSPMFVPITMAAIINLGSFFMGLTQVLKGSNSEGLFVQMFIAGFVVVNSMPINEAMVLRRDKGRMPLKITTISTCLALALYMGFKYGSLIEDHYMGYRQRCEGWRSLFCKPKRPAFLGDAPITLIDGLKQGQRWVIGLMQVGFSQYSPLSFGTRSMGLIMGLTYAYYCALLGWLIPFTIYAFLPRLALLNGVSAFPKLSEPWFVLYVFLFLGAYGHDLLEFIVEGSTVKRWWNDQRMWMIRSTFSSVISTYGFSLTNKFVDDEQSKRYDQGVFDFGVPSPMFVPITMAAIINLVSFFMGLTQVLKGSNSEGLFVQMFIAGFVVVNSMPINEAMVLRRDKGRMPLKITTISTCLALALYVLASQLLFL
ncbi:cellulose synthase-like protein g3 [Quercus suber]|uniref:Cellulose synthase-like protein g3 n=1 Tax=Quercus suber TaxID=58331 RepID=A0AAW0K1E0_QUESU